jgi:hypothetical protein
MNNTRNVSQNSFYKSKYVENFEKFLFLKKSLEEKSSSYVK